MWTVWWHLLIVTRHSLLLMCKWLAHSRRTLHVLTHDVCVQYQCLAVSQYYRGIHQPCYVIKHRGSHPVGRGRRVLMAHQSGADSYTSCTARLRSQLYAWPV